MEELKGAFVETREHLERGVEGVIRDLVRVGRGELDPEDFVRQRVISMKRTQSLGSDGWETVSYELILVWGGPNISLITDPPRVVGAWFPHLIDRGIHEEDALEGVRRIEGYLDVTTATLPPAGTF